MAGTKTAGGGRKASSVIAGGVVASALVGLVWYALPSQNPPSVPTTVAFPEPAAPIATSSAPSRTALALNSAAPPTVGDTIPPAPLSAATNLPPQSSGSPGAVANYSGAPAALMPPRFDLVRVEQDGSALVAGKAAPNSNVSVLVDAEVEAATAADRSGGFVAMFDLTYSSQPRVVTLRMQLANGVEMVSEEQVILSPANVATPPSVASSAPAAAIVLSDASAPPALPTHGQQSLVGESPTLPAASAVAPSAPVSVGEAPAAILVSPDGVKMLQDSSGRGQGAIQPVVVSTISYTASGAVQLGGWATAGTLVRLYLNGVFTAEISVGRDGDWGDVLPDIVPGIYTLRADQVDASGKVTARFETPFQRETPASLAAMLGPAQQPAKPSAPQTGVAPTADIALAPAVVATAAPPRAAQPTTGLMPNPTAQVQPIGSVTDTAPALGAAPSQSATPTQAAPPQPGSARVPVSVTVQPGFTLWAIARDQFGEGILYVQVYEANKDRIRNPDLIYPGQVFALPALQDGAEESR